MELKEIDIKLIELPDWTTKYKDPEEEFRINMSLQKFGQRNPIHVRRYWNFQEEQVELIDGRSVYRALQALGKKTVLCIDHGFITLHSAKALHLQLNFSTKSAHPLHLAQVVYDLSQEMGPEVLMNELPFTKEQIEYYIKLHEYDWMANLNKTEASSQMGLF